MIIKRVKLTGFKRLALNRIHVLEYRPTMANLIMGTNGSGKTSLITEINNLFGDKKNYLKDGGLEVDIIHNNIEYRLTSYNGKHSFIKNNIELNDGHTGKVQQSFINSEFGLSQVIRDVFIGNKKFTTMSPLERKEWFTMISPISFDYVVSTFTRAKTRVRDLEGALKLQNTRLFELKESIKNSDLKALEETSKKLEEDIAALYTKLKESKVVSRPDISHIERMLTQLQNIKKVSYHVEPIVIDEKLNNINKEINTLIDAIEELQDKVTTVEKIDIGALVKEVEMLEKLDCIKYNYDEMFAIISSDITSSMVDKYNELYIEYTQEEVNTLTNKRNLLTESMNRLNTDLQKRCSVIEAQKEALTHDTVKCPKCDNSFKPNYDEKALTENIRIERILKDKLKSKQAEFDSVDKRLTEIDTFIRVKNDITTQFKNNKYLLDILFTGNIGYSFSKIKTIANEIKDLPKLKDELIKAKATAEATEKTSLEQQALLKKELDSMHLNLKTLYKRRERVLKHLKRNTAIKASIESYNALMANIENSIKEAKSISEDYTTDILNNYINDMLKILITHKQSIDTELKEATFNMRSVDTLTLDIDDLKKKISAGKLIVNGLSPNKGLIAKSVKSFIGNFILKMNKVIREIWSYDMEIIAPTMSDSGDLTYRFPVKVNNSSDNIDGDVKDTSTGMTDIINLAFILVSKEYLGKEDYPLYLDEFATSFDSEHRRSAIDLVSKLLDNKQVFMISHYSDLLYSIDNLDISILSSDNIEIANLKEYNKNMDIK